MIQFLESSPQEDKELLRLGRKLSYKPGFFIFHFQNFREFVSKIKRAEKTILASKGFTINDDMNVVVKSYEQDKEAIERELAHINSEEYRMELRSEAEDKKSAMQVSGKSVEDRVREFSKLNYLLAYRFADTPTENCALPDAENVPKPKPEQPKKEPSISVLELEAEALTLRLKLLNFNVRKRA